jgi:2'-5' RNA ligase
MTPQEWLHMTTLVAGPADAFTDGQIAHMVRHAQADLSTVAPIAVQLGKILYHPEAIMLAVSPAEALDPLRDAARSATEQAIGRPLTNGPWTPHITLCYSTEQQSAAPLISALGLSLPERHITISTLSLVIQDGSERQWKWSTVGVAKLGPQHSG